MHVEQIMGSQSHITSLKVSCRVKKLIILGYILYLNAAQVDPNKTRAMIKFSVP